MDVSDICGPLMQNEIDLLVISMKHRYDRAYDGHDVCELERLDRCINKLIHMNDDNFYSIYVNLPVDYEDYQNNYDEHEDKLYNATYEAGKNGVKNELDDVTDDVYSYYEYTYAFISDISLINRCMLISKAPLNNAINAFAHHSHYIGEVSRTFGINSCKLLHLNGFNLYSLLKLARCRCDYESMKYITQVMSEIDLYNVLYNVLYNNDMHNDITTILIIDRCKQIGNKYISSLLDKCIENEVYSHVIKCYYIILYDINEKYTTKYIPEKNDVINKLLDFYYRPRGLCTKGARIN
jgi:hypothetical protein